MVYWTVSNRRINKWVYNNNYDAQTPVPTTPAPVSVTIKSSTFVPDIVEISKGTTVIWTNDDGVRHTVTSISGAFDSGNIDPGKTYSYTFNQAGPFEYSLCNPSEHTTRKSNRDIIKRRK